MTEYIIFMKYLYNNNNNNMWEWGWAVTHSIMEPNAKQYKCVCLYLDTAAESHD